MPNRNALGPDERPAELLNLVFDEYRNGLRSILEQFDAIHRRRHMLRCGRTAGGDTYPDRSLAQQEEGWDGVR